LNPPKPHFPSPGTPPPDLIAVGFWDSGEFALLRKQLDPEARWPHLPSLDAVIDRIAPEEKPPELVLLAQSRPTGGAEQALIEHLRVIAPLTRIIVVAGTWCEGELRTGRPLVGVIRLYWYEFAPWWQGALHQTAMGEAPPWSEPLDDVRAGQMSWRRHRRYESFQAPALDAQTVAIDSIDYAVYESLARLLSPFGCECVWQPRHRPERWTGEPTLGIFDGAQLDAPELEQLRRFRCRLEQASAPVVLLLDFPREEHFQIAHTAGVTAILAKPYQADWLIEELTRLAEHRVVSHSALHSASRREHLTTRRPAPFA
jgi:hypothetical protein